ncbi:hypothetical protein [Halorubellus sp. PRR65]|uniref:hypothetical protein n=1 Tax=Halorubellus sp. PRR65 TaxID=3098148 RepID=UPI002B25D653|nr:hypothetical protein [Halorubellus sp. PRR65]
MHRRRVLAVCLLAIALATVAAPALGHVPAFSADNDDPGNATYVDDPAKSWSFYDDVEANESAYYRTYLDAGERLQVSTFVPRDGDFRPGFVVMSPALNGTDGVPSHVEVPEGYGARVVDPDPAVDAEYEPFTPAALYRTAALNATVDTAGTYYVAAYEPDRGAGAVGVVVGHRETFGVEEYVTVPLDRPRIHEWEGQPAWFVYGPILLGALATLGAFAWWTGGDREDATDGGARTTRSLVLAVASALYGGGAAGVAVQTAVAASVAGVTLGVLVTLAFVAIPALLGWYLLGRAIGDRPSSRASRGTLLGVALLGVATWAGFVVGPALVVLAAFLPGEARA